MKNIRIALASILAGCAAAGSAWAAEESKLTAPVEKKDLAIEIEVPGVFKAEDKKEIAVEPEAYKGSLIITKIATEGEAVKEGDLLLKFDKQDLKKEIEKAEQAALEARVKLQKAQAEAEAHRIDSEAALNRLQKELAQAQKKCQGRAKDLELKLAEKEKGLQDQESRIADSRVNMEQLKTMYERKELHTATENILMDREQRSLKNQDRDLKLAREQLAYAKEFEYPLETEKLELEVAGKQAELAKSRAKAQAEKAEKAAEVSKAERQQKETQETLDQLNHDVEKLTVKSPRAGIVFYGAIGQDGLAGMIMMQGGARDLKVGGRVQTHQTLLTIASMENLSIQMKVLENQIQHMKPGLPMTVRPDAFPNLQIAGKLTEVGQVATQQDIFGEVRQFTVKGTYEEAHAELRAGMNCRVTVHADRIPAAVQVPVLAVFQEGEKHFCYVQAANRPEKRAVKLGAANGQSVQVLEGLKASETVYLYDPFRE